MKKIIILITLFILSSCIGELGSNSKNVEIIGCGNIPNECSYDSEYISFSDIQNKLIINRELLESNKNLLLDLDIYLDGLIMMKAIDTGSGINMDNSFIIDDPMIDLIISE